MGRVLALLVGVVVSAVGTGVAVRVFPVFLGVPLPSNGGVPTDGTISFLALVVGPVPGAFLAGYLSGDGPRAGALLGLAVATLPLGFVHVLLALFLMALGVYGGVAGGDIGGGLVVALLVFVFATLFLAVLVVSQTGAALAGAAGSHVRALRDRDRAAVSEP